MCRKAGKHISQSTAKCPTKECWLGDVFSGFFPLKMHMPWSPCCLTDFPLCVFCSDYQTISLEAISDLIWNFSYLSGLIVVD
jgi:hypothetical protein